MRGSAKAIARRGLRMRMSGGRIMTLGRCQCGVASRYAAGVLETGLNAVGASRVGSGPAKDGSKTTAVRRMPIFFGSAACRAASTHPAYCGECLRLP